MNTQYPLLDNQETHDLFQLGISAANSTATKTLSNGKAGDQSSTARGTGIDFDDYRIFQTGDDQRHIDWRASARSKQTVVRTYFQDLTQPNYLLIDRSSSMRFGLKKRLKVTQATRIAVAFCGQYFAQKNDVTAILLNPSYQQILLHSGSHFFNTICKQLVTACPPLSDTSAPPQWQRVLANLKQQLQPGSELTILSDFYTLKETDRILLNAIGQSYNTRAIRIIEPNETQVIQTNNLTLKWKNQQIHTYANNQIVYLKQKYQEHEQLLEQLFNRAGIQYHTISCAEDDLLPVLQS